MITEERSINQEAVTPGLVGEVNKLRRENNLLRLEIEELKNRTQFIEKENYNLRMQIGRMEGVLGEKK